MDIQEKVGVHLDQIKQLKGVENAILTQRDGNPIHSSGSWFSKEEIFNISSVTSTIFNVGIHLHPTDLKYILIEGRKAKILIAPLNSPIHPSLNKLFIEQGIVDTKHEYFIVITAQPDTNLGGIFLQISECLKKIKTSLITSGESFKPPLVQFLDDQGLQKVIQGFNLKEEGDYKLFPFSMNISERIAIELKKVLKNFNTAIPDLKYAHITTEGGFIISKILNTMEIPREELDYISAMSYALFQMVNRCAVLLKKMYAESILLDCDNTFQFIYGMGNSIFSTEIGKSKQRLGLIRLILPQFTKKINMLVKQASELQDQEVFDSKNLSGEFIIV